MKLWETIFTESKYRANNKKSLRKINSLKKIKKGKNKKTKITSNLGKNKAIAPSSMDLYTKKDHDEMIVFVNDIERLAHSSNTSTSQKVHICFRDTTKITASAGLWLLSKIESLIIKYPHVKYRVTKPPAVVVGDTKQKEYVVDSVLNRIGFYSALNIKKREMREISNVKCWEVSRGEKVVGSEIGNLLKKITENLSHDYSKLYRPLIEAMSNSVEHAYREDLYTPNDLSNPTKWWCFAALRDNKLIVLMCDLGVGIPNTLNVTQPENLIKKLIALIGKPLTHDSDYIKAALQVKKTRTKLGYRGKGGTDLQSIIESTPLSSLHIISNKGNYKYTNRNHISKGLLEEQWDNKLSIGGTIVQWSVTLPVCQEGEKS